MVYISKTAYFLRFHQNVELNVPKKNIMDLWLNILFATDPNSIVYYDGEPNNSLQGE